MVKLKLDFSETHSLVRFANKMTGFYGHPTYLVGSQLYSETPRDVDLVCIIPDKEFRARYYPDWYLGEDKSKEEVEKFFLGIHTGIHLQENWDWYEDMNFKVYPQSYVDEHFTDKQKIRLDTRKY